MQYYEKAIELSKKGKSPFNKLRLASKMELLNYQKESFIKKVRILTAKNSCKNCQKQNNKSYSIQEALKEMPIPCRSCTFDLNQNGKYFCRCTWLADI